MNFKSVLPAAVFAASIVLTSCGGNKPAAVTDVGDGYDDATSLLDVLGDNCAKVADKEFCGVGEGTSTKQQMARTIAQAQARNDAALKIKVTLESAFKLSGMNSVNDVAAETAFARIAQNVSDTFSNMDVAESKSQFNKAEGKYRVYVRVTVKKEDVFKATKNVLSNSQVISDAATSKVLMDIIDAELDK